MIKLVHILWLYCLFGCNHPESKDFKRYKEVIIEKEIKSELDGYKVIGIKDGDTFIVLIEGKEQVIRLAHIDCPEKNQPFGKRAKQFASDLCFGKLVHLKHKNKYDRNKRLIAEVILSSGENVNRELVHNGLAWHFKKYSDNQEYAELEINARNNKLGLWIDPHPMAPWDNRKLHRSGISTKDSFK